ncbi:MAG TPA: HlyD family type I secretion periplasmic adaptor subunit [Stellaceae bacterium]|jgi:HlyD family secretion protein|nr:HlyD family type I secretion periplasmic adaptor subunit [Stellaceae bacterium]
MSMTTITLLPDHPPPPTPLGRMRELVLAGSALIGIFVIGFGTWAAFAPLQSAAIAPGMVVSSSHRKTLQHLESGIIRTILVHDGDAVKAGQVLVTLDDTRAKADLAAIKGQLWDARAQEARLQAERDDVQEITFPADLEAQKSDPTVAATLAGQQKIFDTERLLQDSKVAAIGDRIKEVHEQIDGLQAELKALETRSSLLQQDIANVQMLVSKGLERKPHLLELLRDLAEVDGEHGDTLAQIAKAKQSIAEAQVDILSLQNDRQQEVAKDLRDTQKKLHELEEQDKAAADVLARTDIRAPEDGTVTDLRVHTPGGVVNAGEPLLDLVPQDDTLMIEARVRPQDIDGVREGLPAEVRLLPYRERRTPPIDATVTYVSADRIVDPHTHDAYYEAKLRVDPKELKAMAPEVKMVPGMPSEAMIKTGQTTVALYALSPLLDGFHHAFAEK